MAKKNRGKLVGMWMSELQLSHLEFIRKPGETRSATVRDLIEDAWVRMQTDIEASLGDGHEKDIPC